MTNATCSSVEELGYVNLSVVEEERHGPRRLQLRARLAPSQRVEGKADRKWLGELQLSVNLGIGRVHHAVLQ